MIFHSIIILWINFLDKINAYQTFRKSESDLIICILIKSKEITNLSNWLELFESLYHVFIIIFIQL